MPETQRLKALISLLDDPNEDIVNDITGEIYSYGTEAISLLESAWESSFDETMQQRIENIIHKIQYEIVKQNLHSWALTNSHDLLAGYLIITQYQYPDINTYKIREQLDVLIQDVWLELNNDLTSLEKTKVLNHVMFEIHKYKSTLNNADSPHNLYLNTLLDTKKGKPLSLSILYLLIAQSVDMPVYGVMLPNNFILCYTREQLHDKQDFHFYNETLFYINPVKKGTIFTYREIDLFLQQLKIPRDESYYVPCNNIDIVRVLLKNLQFSYDQLGNAAKAKEMETMIVLLNAITGHHL